MDIQVAELQIAVQRGTGRDPGVNRRCACSSRTALPDVLFLAAACAAQRSSGAHGPWPLAWGILEATLKKSAAAREARASITSIASDRWSSTIVLALDFEPPRRDAESRPRARVASHCCACPRCDRLDGWLRIDGTLPA